MAYSFFRRTRHPIVIYWTRAFSSQPTKQVGRRPTSQARPRGGKKEPPKSQRRTAQHLEEEWNDAFPQAKPYDQATMQLPIRMGRPEIAGALAPRADGNPELIKIPNFFHLTPSHIEKHCNALKLLMTPFPPPNKLNDDDDDDDDDRILRIHTREYVTPTSSSSHPGARKVKLQVYLKDLCLNSRARQKLILLAGRRFNQRADELTLVSDRCPTRKQNQDYLFYLLTVLLHEANKCEVWEEEKEELGHV